MRLAMAGFPDRDRYAVRCLGSFAARALKAGARDEVAAVFQRSFYIRLSGALVCVGIDGLEAGPLNMISTAPQALDWRTHPVRAGAPVAVCGDGIMVDGRLAFDLSGAVPWRPPLPPHGWSPATLSNGLAGLEDAAKGRLPGDGLGIFILIDRAAEVTPLLRRASGPVGRLRMWCRRSLRREAGIPHDGPPGIEALLGLGPGLTPSGDDFLGGMMIALSALGCHGPLGRLAATVRRLAPARTTPISVSHLAATMAGHGAAPVHAALNAVLAGDMAALTPAVERIGRVGHSSGWDTLAGMVTVLREWRSSVSRMRTAAGHGRHNSTGRNGFLRSACRSSHRGAKFNPCSIARSRR